ncbi:MAG: response regulator [Nannocystaceae bacterium]
MRVLVADDDPFSAAILETLLVSAGHQAVLVENGAEAWEALQGPDAPRIVFLDWVMPGIDGLELCRKIRGLTNVEYTYVVMVSSRNKQRDISLGYQAGADEFITKPYKADEVLDRLRVATRLLESTNGVATLRQAFGEARSAAGGDVIVRSGRRVGRVMFFEGRVAWAHISGEPGSLAAMLADVATISREDVRSVLEECTETGRSFADVLVDWGLITRLRLRSIVRDWIRDKVQTIAGLPQARVFFSPEARTATGDMHFPPEEVIPATLLEPLTLPPTRPEAAVTESVMPPARFVADLDDATALTIGERLDRAIAIEGALSAAVFDLRGGICVGSRGSTIDPDLVWSKLRLVTMGELWDDLEDIMISTRQNIYVLRPFTRSPPRIIVLAIDRATTKIGMVRRALAECTDP